MKSLSSLLVYVDDTTASDARLGLACDLSDRFEACVIGISASEPEPPMYDPLGGLGDILVTLREAAEDDIRRARHRFETLALARGVHFEWRGRLGAPAAAVAREARCADLVILGPKSPLSPYRSPDPADVLMAIGRPILIVPDDWRGACLDATALVAWKDTREAQRAVAAALPLLRESKAVQVLEVAKPDESQAAAARVEDVAHFLARHDVQAVARVVIDEERVISDRLRSEADGLQAGLIVAGGYGHARLREWALGGVTSALFNDCKVCLLVTH